LTSCAKLHLVRERLGGEDGPFVLAAPEGLILKKRRIFGPSQQASDLSKTLVFQDLCGVPAYVAASDHPQRNSGFPSRGRHINPVASIVKAALFFLSIWRFDYV
jgi:hypothetical protein